MAFKEITPPQAHDILTKDGTAIYIDVRSPREFENGHPAGAVNIPVAFPDPARGMVLNPDFVSVVEKTFPKDKKIVLGCQAGGRSARAAGMLAEVGYSDLSNMLGGFGGMRDQTGKVITLGWEESGLPMSKENGEGVSYQSLSVKAGK